MICRIIQNVTIISYVLQLKPWNCPTVPEFWIRFRRGIAIAEKKNIT